MREAIETALRELVRRRRVQRMVQRAGMVDLHLTVEGLLTEREAE